MAGEKNIFDKEKASAALHLGFQVLKILKTEFWESKEKERRQRKTKKCKENKEKQRKTKKNKERQRNTKKDKEKKITKTQFCPNDLQMTLNDL